MGLPVQISYARFDVSSGEAKFDFWIIKYTYTPTFNDRIAYFESLIIGKFYRGYPSVDWISVLVIG